MSAYVPQVGDYVRVGKGKLGWAITAIYADGLTAQLRTGVGRLGRRGRIIERPLSDLSLYGRVDIQPTESV